MQRLLREIFCIAYVITFTLIYGNLFSLIINKIIKENKILQNEPSSSLINTNITTIINTPSLKIHYPTMLILFADANLDLDI